MCNQVTKDVQTTNYKVPVCPDRITPNIKSTWCFFQLKPELELQCQGMPTKMWDDYQCDISIRSESKFFWGKWNSNMYCLGKDT